MRDRLEMASSQWVPRAAWIPAPPRTIALVLVAWLAVQFAPYEAAAQEVPGCGSLSNAYGPYDYRDPVAKRDNLPIVEINHFTPQVEALVRGRSGSLFGDLRYTLRAFPNHHRALATLAKYALQGGAFPDDDPTLSLSCFFARAIAFAPDDAIVRLVVANHLFRTNDHEGAREQYETALRLAPHSPDINYSAGLFFLASGDLERARQCAAVAYGAGYPLDGLRKKLAEVGEIGNEGDVVVRPNTSVP